MLRVWSVLDILKILFPGECLASPPYTYQTEEAALALATDLFLSWPKVLSHSPSLFENNRLRNFCF